MKAAIIGSDMGLSPFRRQAIIWTNTGLLCAIQPKVKVTVKFWSTCKHFNSRKKRLKMLSAKWRPSCLGLNVLTHWSRVTHMCVSKLASIGLDKGLSPSRRQAIIWTNGGILLIRNLGTNFSEIIIGIQAFSFKKIRSKMSSGKLRPFCVGLNGFRSIPGCLPVVRSDKKWWWKTCTISAGNICITYGYGRWVQSPICHGVSFTDCKG